MTDIADLDIPAGLRRKFIEAGALTTARLRVFSPESLVMVFRLTELQVQALNDALGQVGEDPFPYVAAPKAERKVKAKPTCIEAGCEEPWHGRYRRCFWHWLATLGIENQVRAAEFRLEQASKAPDFVPRARVKPQEWPPGQRWCSGCQSFIPLHYASGSRCRACASRAAHASRIERTYEITREEYDQLFAWQDGRCYICGRRSKKRLAIDHDHRTNEVRGLLCAGDEWGCNVSLRMVLNDVAAARRLLDYVEWHPLDRMKSGEPAPSYGKGAAELEAVTEPRIYSQAPF